jgi:uncharacterized membrane protein
MSVLRNLREELTGVVALLVLGAGFLAMAFPPLSPIPFWVIWIVGFAVVLPLVGIATGEALDEDEDPERDPSDRGRSRRDRDPLAELRRRYAEGEIDELEFERRLERLLETEDEAAAAAYVDRRRADHDREGEADPERDAA